MDGENRIDETRQPAQQEPEAAELRMEQAAEFWSKYDDDTLPPVLQTFKARAVEYVQALPDKVLANEDVAYALPSQLEDRAGEVGMTPSLKERLWQRVFAEERSRRGIADANDYSEPLNDGEQVAPTAGEPGQALDELTSHTDQGDFPDDQDTP
jgi:hypothetical protein